MPILRPARLLPALLLSLLPSILYPSSPKPVVFDSFTYTGRDAISADPLPAGYYRNPILAGFYPDPSICRVPGKNPDAPADYYLINSTFAYFPGIPIFHSRDLVNWTQLGHVIDRPSQLDYDGLGVDRGLFAPAISFHDGVFYVVCTHIDGGGNFLVTATDPAGPWSDPVWLKFDGIDPSLFFDDDGRAWLVNNGNPPDNQPLYPGHRAIWIQEFDTAARKLTGPRQIIVNGGVDLSQKPIWIEGPHLYKRAGWYYLCCAEGGTSTDHSQVILRSKSPTGPFAPWEKNPILTQRDLDGSAPGTVTCTGHADLVIGPDGNWWSVFLGCRPYAPDRWTTGRETFLLPVTWTDDGWPQILPPGQRVPLTAPSPVAASASEPSVVTPLNGNFTWRDDFTAKSLSLFWLTLRGGARTPSALSDTKNQPAPWLTLDSAAHRLLLTPRPEPLSGKHTPAFLARRVQHARFDVSTTFSVPTSLNTAGGLALFQNETHHYAFTVLRSADNALTLAVDCANGSAPARLASTPLPADTSTLSLRLHADGPRLQFAYSFSPDTAVSDPTAWKTLLADADTYPVTVQAAGGGSHFTGAVVGLFAQSNLSANSTTATASPASSLSAATAHVPYPPRGKAEIAHQQLLQKARTGKIDLYFLGDSITRRWDALDYPDFLAHWNKHFHGWNAADFGWGGDNTHQILWRIQNGELDGVNPKVIVLLAGTNNIGRAPKPGAAQDVAEGIAAILATCHAKAPDATVILMSIFPRNDSDVSNKVVAEANALIAKLADGQRVRLLDINDQLADPNGKLFPGLTMDKLHPTLKGYEIWANALTPLLTELLGPRASEDHAPPPTGDIIEPAPKS